jgi:hypothetical protein
MWLPQDDLQDSSSFSSPPLVLLVTFTQLFSPNTTARTVLRVESQLSASSTCQLSASSTCQFTYMQKIHFTADCQLHLLARLSAEISCSQKFQITVPLTRFLSCVLLLAPLVAFTVSMCAFCFCRLNGKPTRSFTVSGVEHAQHNQDQFRFHYISTLASMVLR